MNLRRWMALALACLCVPFGALAGESAVRYTVEFDYVRTMSPNSVAWLYQPGTTINQPVVYSADETHYLRWGYDDRYSGTGAIYMTGEEKPDLSEKVIILRGRNCMDNALFGSLSEYRYEEYYARHPLMYLITPEGEYQLDIFAGVRLKHKDRDSWLVPEDDAARMEALPGILEKSFLTPREDALPQPGDAWAILTTESQDGSGSRFVVYARKRLIDPSATEAAVLNEMEMDARETLNGYVTVEGVGSWMIYGQNDPLWNRLIFEVDNSSRRRPFGDGGCGPTAIAMAVVNLMDKEELPVFSTFSNEELGYRFCSCAIGDRFCYQNHVPYQLKDADEYLRYFPLAVAEFAMGNNLFEVQGRYDSYGTSMAYLEALCTAMGIRVQRTNDMAEAIAFLRQNDATAVTCASAYGNPFTRSSHFLALAEATDEHLYVMDPLRREDYGDLDPRGMLEIISPGLVRMTLEDAEKIKLAPIYLLTKEQNK